MAIVISGDVIIAAVSAAGGAGAAFAVGFRRTYNVIKPMIEPLRFIVEDWNGVPGRPGVEGRKGLMVRLADHDDVLAAIQHELTTNGGSSLRDAIRTIEERTRGFEAKLDLALISAAAPAPTEGNHHESRTSS